ncbi:apolipoprotein N-acyltransferase [Lysobacter korlensis]|uniref:Apolipoprotein N-acyltransferase n=1 Tax=Lysobacter korlensis TaxID=553636 RepID=A0ABV6RWU5_9GAMM
MNAARAATAEPAAGTGGTATAGSGHRSNVQAAVPLWLALVLSVAAGPVLDAGFPDRGWWPLTFVGVGMMLVALRGRSLLAAVHLGLVAGLSFFLIHIQWATVFLGPVPWLALSTVMALWSALGGTLIALAYRLVPGAWPGVLGRLLLLPAVVAGLWTAKEGISAVWPYGGFSWGRVGFSMAESPLASLFPWIGTAAVSFVAVFLVAFAIECWLERGLPRLPRATAVVAGVALAVVVPAWPVIPSSTLTVAAVQGNAKAGYFDQRERGDNLADQVEATEPLFGEDVDVVVWPEGSSDIDPLASNAAAAVFDRIAREMDAPLIAGAITERDGRVYNTSMLWQEGEGATDLYDKKHPVPFGEYVPDRPFWRQFAPRLIDMIGRDYTPGTLDSVFDLGDVSVGVNICFDIVDDQLIRESVLGGAQAIFAQTNNADFGTTDESIQQLQIAQVRALETARTVVNISTVGVSAIVLPTGEIVDRLDWYTPGAMVREIPLSEQLTLAVLAGRGIELLVSGIGLAGILIPPLTRRSRA